MLDQALMCLATTIYMESAHEPRQALIALYLADVVFLQQGWFVLS